MNFISELLGTILDVFYQITGDYGIAIVLITLLIKLLLLPFNIKQRKQMETQKELGEKISLIKKKYSNNQTKMNEEIQKVYAENGFGSMGCLSTLIQMPIMLGLHHGIKGIITDETQSILLPWISSLLLNDPIRILPIATLLIQVIPMLYPYFKCFKELKLQKASVSSIVIMMVMNGMFVFVLPSGVGLYYWVSGVFSAVEQLAYYMIKLKMNKKYNYNAA